MTGCRMLILVILILGGVQIMTAQNSTSPTQNSTSPTDASSQPTNGADNVLASATMLFSMLLMCLIAVGS